MGVPLYERDCFSLAAFDVLSSCLILGSLIIMGLREHPFVLKSWATYWILGSPNLSLGLGGS